MKCKYIGGLSKYNADFCRFLSFFTNILKYYFPAICSKGFTPTDNRQEKVFTVHEIWYNKFTGFDDSPQFQENQ